MQAFLFLSFIFASPAHADEFTAHFHFNNPPRPLPPIVFEDAGGAQHTLGDYRGRFVLLNVWATWCPPCVKEMPSLEALQKRMGDKLIVLPVSQDRSEGLVSYFYQHHAVKDLPIATDTSGQVPFTLHISGLPTTLLINPQGQEVGRLEGDADWNSQAAVALLYSQLNLASGLN